MRLTVRRVVEAVSLYPNREDLFREYRRLMEPLGYIPPAEAEQRYFDSLDSPAVAA